MKPFFSTLIVLVISFKALGAGRIVRSAMLIIPEDAHYCAVEDMSNTEKTLIIRTCSYDHNAYVLVETKTTPFATHLHNIVEEFISKSWKLVSVDGRKYHFTRSVEKQ